METSLANSRSAGSRLPQAAVQAGFLLLLGGFIATQLLLSNSTTQLFLVMGFGAALLGIYLPSWRWLRNRLRLLELRALSLANWEALALKHDRSGWWYVLLDHAGNSDKQRIYQSPALRKMLGLDPSEACLSCDDWHSMIYEDDLEKVDAASNQYLEGVTDRCDLTYRLRRADGKLIWVHSTVNVDRDANGVPVALFGIDDDVTEQVQQAYEHNIYSHLVQCLDEAVMVTDADRKIIKVNDRFTEITGWSAEEVEGRSPRILSSGLHTPSFYEGINENLAEGGAWSGEIIDRRKDGSYFTALMRISRLDDLEGKPRFYFSTFADVTELTHSREKLEFLSQFDPLTGLYNMEELKRRLEYMDLEGVSADREMALVMIDIDNFQAINDAYGRDVGDEVLRTIGHRLQRITRNNECTAHLPADSFAALLIRKGIRESLPEIEARLMAHIATPITVPDGEITVSCTIGVALYPEVSTPSELTQHAETALHVARGSGPAQLRHYDPAMSTQIQEDFLLASELRLALASGEGLSIALQQVVALENGQSKSAEVLARWVHPSLGFIPPDKFIRVAENNGLIKQLSDHVIDLACETLVDLGHSNRIPPEFKFAINLSSQQLNDPHFARNLLKRVQLHGVTPMQIELELTESVLMDNPERSKAMLEELRNEGFSIAIDDFGTGYSSLAYLSLLPLDKLKVDRSFIMAMEGNEADPRLIRMIIGLAQDLNLDVVAEGIETDEIADKLRLLGARYGQGYYFAKPVPPAEFAEALSKQA